MNGIKRGLVIQTASLLSHNLVLRYRQPGMRIWSRFPCFKTIVGSDPVIKVVLRSRNRPSVWSEPPPKLRLRLQLLLMVNEK